MSIVFNVIEFSGWCGGLNMQIIPLDLKRNPDVKDSIVINETAFSLVEYIFLKNRNYSHWGVTYIELEDFCKIKADLDDLRLFLKYKDELKPEDNVKLISQEETNIFISNYSNLKCSALKMIDDITIFLDNIESKNIDGISILGI